jgi:uncharacterized OsmC-like protein
MPNVCECFPRLKEITEAREVRYRLQPEAPGPEGPQRKNTVRVISIGNLEEVVKCQRSGHSFIISEPADCGGESDAPYPLEYLLGGAVGCFSAVFAFYAAKLGVRYQEMEIVARAAFDVRGHMIPDAPPAGFRKVEMEIHVVSDEPEERLREVEALALRGCPGIDTLRRPVPVESQVFVKRP